MAGREVARERSVCCEPVGSALGWSGESDGGERRDHQLLGTVAPYEEDVVGRGTVEEQRGGGGGLRTGGRC